MTPIDLGIPRGRDYEIVATIPHRDLGVLTWAFTVEEIEDVIREDCFQFNEDRNRVIS